MWNIHSSVVKHLKVARYPEFSRSTNLESKLIRLFVFVNFEQTVRFGSLEPFTVRKIGDSPHFLSALASNNWFIIKLVKMCPWRYPSCGGRNFENKLRLT